MGLQCETCFAPRVYGFWKGRGNPRIDQIRTKNFEKKWSGPSGPGSSSALKRTDLCRPAILPDKKLFIIASGSHEILVRRPIEIPTSVSIVTVCLTVRNYESDPDP